MEEPKDKPITKQDFIDWIKENEIPLSMTSSEARFLEVLINTMEKDPLFKKGMTEVGDKHNIFNLVYKFCKTNKK